MNDDKAKQNTIDEMIDVLKAFKEGNKIERRSINENSLWEDVINSKFNFEKYQYKIKIKQLTTDEIFEKAYNKIINTKSKRSKNK